MPKLDTTLHLDMLRAGKRRRTWSARVRRAWQALFAREDVYGLEWGDPESSPPLTYVRDHFVRPYVTSETTVLEIGPGGGRWTRYMLAAEKLYAVDFHQELLDELRAGFDRPNVVFVKNNGHDFPGVPPESLDFVFSFGAFVHFDLEIIEPYLHNLKPLLKPHANVVIQYSDKTKPMAQQNQGFSENDSETMRRLVTSHGYEIREEDTKTLWHSSVIRFGVRDTD